MYELVSSSLPNGLIPGSHGFATVAMTKGLPDVLRTRLEAYCAYSHRTSTHDATYFTENPVNWFHVTLPQGEHVMGRVAPADFDYTGRTNRLARLLVFSKNRSHKVLVLYFHILYLLQHIRGTYNYLHRKPMNYSIRY